MNASCRSVRAAAAAVVLTWSVAPGPAQTTALTYQGRLDAGPQHANGPHDFRFRLFDAALGGAAVGATLCADNVTVVDGLFTVQIDFGQQYAAGQRYLEIEVRPDTGLACSNATGFVTMSPRQLLTAAPRASHANAAFALDAADGSPTNAVFVDGVGYVGIGTTTPASNLHVMTAGGKGITIQGAFAIPLNTAYMSFANGAGTELGYVGDANVGDNSIFLGANTGDAVLTTAAGRVLTATAGGSVGIGTTTPSGGLHVKKEPVTTGGTLALEGTTHTYMTFFPDGFAAGRKGYLGFPSASSTALTIANEPGTFISLSAAGGVGIGTSTPPRRLTVWDTLSVEASPGFMPILGVPRPGSTTYRTAMFIDPQGDGVVSGDRKSFREINPLDPATDIWYVCLEGPEAAMYVRGTGRLRAGHAVVDLPSHFTSLASERGMTVQLTPLSKRSKGLAVVSKSLGGVEVAELADGNGDYEFDWEVKAVRRRYENYQVVKPWDEVLPSDSDREKEWQERLREAARHH